MAMIRTAGTTTMLPTVAIMKMTILKTTVATWVVALMLAAMHSMHNTHSTHHTHRTPITHSRHITHSTHSSTTAWGRCPLNMNAAEQQLKAPAEPALGLGHAAIAVALPMAQPAVLALPV